LPCSYTLIAEFTKGSEETRDIKCCGGGDKGPWRTSLSLLLDVETDVVVEVEVEMPSNRETGEYCAIAYRISGRLLQNLQLSLMDLVHERETVIIGKCVAEKVVPDEPLGSPLAILPSASAAACTSGSSLSMCIRRSELGVSPHKSLTDIGEW
jgi:hypothetical protein